MLANALGLAMSENTAGSAVSTEKSVFPKNNVVDVSGATVVSKPLAPIFTTEI